MIVFANLYVLLELLVLLLNNWLIFLKIPGHMSTLCEFKPFKKLEDFKKSMLKVPLAYGIPVKVGL